eukprot:351034-Chlamydomonas_euryale.AAC.5
MSGTRWPASSRPVALSSYHSASNVSHVRARPIFTKKLRRKSSMTSGFLLVVPGGVWARACCVPAPFCVCVYTPGAACEGGHMRARVHSQAACSRSAWPWTKV